MTKRSGERGVLDQLAQEARVIRSARMLPKGPLSPQDVDHVRKRFKQFAGENALKLEQIARSMGKGFSAPVLSQFMTGNYAGDNEKVARGVNQYIESWTQQRRTPRPADFVETRVFKDITNVIRKVTHMRSMGVITGPAGVGKTMSLEVLTSPEHMPGSMLIRIAQSRRRGPGLTAALCNKLGVNRRASTDVRFDRLVEYLDGTGRLIVLDEAQKLHKSGLEVVRDLHDETGCPIVLCGTIDIRKEIDDQNEFYGQFSSRIAINLSINERVGGHGRGKRRPLYTEREIREMLSSDSLKLTDDGVAFLTELACVLGLGSLRLASKVAVLAASIRELRDKPIGADELRSVLQQMHTTSWLEYAERKRLEQRGEAVAA